MLTNQASHHLSWKIKTFHVPFCSVIKYLEYFYTCHLKWKSKLSENIPFEIKAVCINEQVAQSFVCCR